MAEKSNELENTSSTELTERKSDDYESNFESVGEDSPDAIGDEPQEIRTQIEETRAQMGETIDAIQEKFSFSNISEQVSEQINSAVETAKGAVYDATIGKAGKFMKNLNSEISSTTVVRTVVNNPFPFILMGIGAGWLAFTGFGGKHRGNGKKSGTNRLPETTGKSTSGSAKNESGGAVSDAYGSVSTAASSAYENVSSAAISAYEGVGNFAGQTREKVGELGTQAREQYDYYIEENPLAVGTVALALGAAVGFSIPSTRYEGELMGEARQNLLQKAQDTAGGLVDKVKDVANEATKTIGEEAKAAGLTQ